MVSSEGYVVRDLADVIDRLDADVDRSSTVEDAGRKLVESARHARELFSQPLVESLVEMATNTGSPPSSSHSPEWWRRPMSTADGCGGGTLVLSTIPVAEDADLLTAFPDALRPEDAPPVLDRLVDWPAGKDLVLTNVPAAPRGLLTAVNLDLAQVMTHLVDRLNSGDDPACADVAAAAEQLLRADAAGLIGLGPALTAACPDDEPGYAGEPHPTACAARR